MNNWPILVEAATAVLSFTAALTTLVTVTHRRRRR